MSKVFIDYFEKERLRNWSRAERILERLAAYYKAIDEGTVKEYHKKHGRILRKEKERCP